MPEDTTIIVVIITALFVLFSVVLAWADHRTRGM